MRTAIITGLVAFVLGAVATVDSWLPGGPYLPGSLQVGLAMAAFVIAGPGLFWMVMMLNDGTGRLTIARYWGVLRALPVWMLVGVCVLFALTLVNLALSVLPSTGSDDENTRIFFRGFAGNIAWIGGVSAATAYALKRMGRTSLPAGRIEEFRRRLRL